MSCYTVIPESLPNAWPPVPTDSENNIVHLTNVQWLGDLVMGVSCCTCHYDYCAHCYLILTIIIFIFVFVHSLLPVLLSFFSCCKNMLSMSMSRLYIEKKENLKVEFQEKVKK